MSGMHPFRVLRGKPRWSAVAVSGIGALTLLAVFGTPGMLVVTLVFIGMAGLGHDGGRTRGGRAVRLRRTGVVRP
ncbi:hypothetical protein [Streptomyces sp. NPDC006355]|uniref:hypothetical protein n=1 Tax=Streptomyces sp. NPDC006355 TaxID=3156758 RepID=UPI0033AEF4F4